MNSETVLNQSIRQSAMVIGSVVLAAGFVALSGCKRTEETKAPPPMDVLVTDAVTRDVQVYREWIGTLDGSENAEIRARVSGYLLKRNYQEGALVKKGDLLFEIDPRPFEASLAEAKSQLEQGKAMQLATEADAQRSKELFDKKVISDKEFINKTQINESNIAKVRALEASVEQAKLNLGFCKITSPVDGVAGIAQAQVGDLVGTANSTVLTSVSTLDPIKIVFPVSESEYLSASARVLEMMNEPLEERPETVELILANGSPHPEKARIFSVDRQVQTSTGTILVTALAANPGNLLRPGFFARARVVAQVLKDAVVVPQRAVAEVQGSFQLAVVGADGKVEMRPVQAGVRTGTDWVISSGLKGGEKVIVEGFQKVKTGSRVAAKPWNPPREQNAGVPKNAGTAQDEAK